MRTPLQKGEQILLVTHTSWVKLILPVIIALAGWVGAFLNWLFRLGLDRSTRRLTYII